MCTRAASAALLLLVAPTTAVALPQGSSCKVLPDTDYNGHDLHQASATSVAACCSACGAERFCGFWTFMPRASHTRATCYLKTSNAGQRPSPRSGKAAYTSGCKNETCAPAPPAPPPSPHPHPHEGGGFGCDPHGGERGVCVNGGVGSFPTAACGDGCANASSSFACATDWDCSLAGACTAGKCQCDAWASGSDCSYLNFQPMDRAALGYIDPTWSSWGGNAILGKDKMYHLFMAEIGPAGRKGLGGWTANSQVAHAVSATPGGPYKRKALVAPPEHHNPTVKVSPVDGSWNLYSIDRGSGPIVASVSTDEGETWTSTTPGVVVSSEQNPGPLLWKNGSMNMWYRAQAKTSSPCSDESIGVQYCANKTAVCSGGVNPIYTHTSEDPSVFQDKRGNFHMLVNALPGGCNPKLQQGGHAWSKDGIIWSEPRVGAYNTTVVFTDGTTMTCGRRERPQMVQDAAGVPVVMFAGVVGCPTAPLNHTPFKGGGDCFTMAQLMVQ